MNYPTPWMFDDDAKRSYPILKYYSHICFKPRKLLPSYEPGTYCFVLSTARIKMWPKTGFLHWGFQWFDNLSEHRRYLKGKIWEVVRFTYHTMIQLNSATETLLQLYCHLTGLVFSNTRAISTNRNTGCTVGLYICTEQQTQLILPLCFQHTANWTFVCELIKSWTCPATRHKGAWGGGRRYSSYSFSTSALEGGEWSASCPSRALAPGKGPPVLIVQEAGWVPEPVWTQMLEEKPFRLCRGSNYDHPVFQPVTRHYTVWATRLAIWTDS
jgi:hypothetical protein